MPWLIGALLALAVGVFGTVSGFDRERAFYPTVTVVVATYYLLFAVLAGGQALPAELLGASVFVAAAVVGFRWTLWVAAVGLAGHGVFDLLHGAVIVDPGVPVWWPAFCSSYDIVAGVYLGVLILRGRVRARA